MALDFPNSPALGATYSSGGVSWKWDGTKWAQSLLLVNPLIVAPPVAANWTPRNGAAISDVANGVQISMPAVTSNTYYMASVAAPTAPYTIDADLTMNTILPTTKATVGGVGWTDGTKVDYLLCGYVGNGSQCNLNQQSLVNFTTINTAGTTYYPIIGMGDIWLRIADNGTNITMSFSTDGITWTPVYTIAKASGYLGSSGYSNVGFLLNPVSGAGNPAHAITLRSWRVH